MKSEGTLEFKNLKEINFRRYIIFVHFAGFYNKYEKFQICLTIQPSKTNSCENVMFKCLSSFASVLK